MTTSRPTTVSRANKTRGGVGEGGAVRHGLGAGAGLEGGLGGGEVGAGVDAEGLGLGAGDDGGGEAAGAGEGDDVGEVVLALGVVVADLGEEVERGWRRRRRGGRNCRAGCASWSRRRRPCASTMASRRAVGVEDEAAVAAGVRGLEAEDDDGGAGGAGVEHRLQRLRADERGVAVEDDDVALEALELRGGLQHGVGGAELLLSARRRGRPGRCARAAAATSSAPWPVTRTVRSGSTRAGGGEGVGEERGARRAGAAPSAGRSSSGCPGRRRAG